MVAELRNAHVKLPPELKMTFQDTWSTIRHILQIISPEYKSLRLNWQHSVSYRLNSQDGFHGLYFPSIAI